MQDFKGRAKGGLLRRTVTFLPQEEIKIPRLGKESVLSIKLHFHPSFEILHLAVGTSGWMNAENRGPIWDAFRGGRGYGGGDLE